MKKKKKYKEKQSHKADAKKLMVPNFFKKWNERKQSQQNKPFFGQKIPQLQEIGIYRQLLDTKAVSWVFLKCDCHNTSNR